VLDKYPALAAVAKSIDEHLATVHPSYFGPNPKHPILRELSASLRKKLR